MSIKSGPFGFLQGTSSEPGARLARALLVRALALGLGLAILSTAAGLAGVAPADEVQFEILNASSGSRFSEVMVLWGNGWSAPSTGRDGREAYRGRCGITRYRWTQVGFGFVPVRDGRVVIRFTGPWTPDETGTPARQPVALCRVRVAGAAMTNPDFSSAAGQQTPSGWAWHGIPGTLRPAGLRPPARGLAEVRLDERTGIQQTISVQAGVPVRITVYARALTPPGFHEMPRLPAGGTPAHHAVRFFQRGVNLGNYLEAPPDEDWGAHYDEQDFDAIRKEGFDHVRIPCAWHHYLGPAPEYTVDGKFFDRVDALVSMAHERGLAVLLNWHHFDAFTSAPHLHIETFERVWVAIAERYAEHPGRIAFELLNEPRDAASTAVMNRVYARVLPAIRRVAPGHTLFLGPGEWNRISELHALRLPATEDNLVVTVHDYEPFLFTHQGASWTLPATGTTELIFPGPPRGAVAATAEALRHADWIRDWFTAYRHLEAPYNPGGEQAANAGLKTAQAWAQYYGRPVHVGEWGCIVSADPASRATYLGMKRRVMERLDLPWTLWDWSASFAYWDRQAAAPYEGLRSALGLAAGRGRIE